MALQDVLEVFYTIPLYLSQWPKTILYLPGPDSFAINTVAAFDTGSTPRVYGNLEDVAVDII